MTTKILTTGYKNSQVLDNLYTNSLLYKSGNDLLQYKNLYCFLSIIEPWPVANTPQDIIYTDSYVKSTHKNIFAMKKITPFDISAVIERIDWTTNTTYNRYNETIDMLASDVSGKLVNKFYVRNSYDQIFKCIWNGENYLNVNGVPSIVEPMILPGNSLSGTIYSSDGYKWKYMYTMDPTTKFKFFDTNWMPVTNQNFISDISASTIGFGQIDEINITNSGNNYITDSTFTSTQIIIDGDGTGASAFAIVANSQISNILITSHGSDYTYANCTIVPTVGYTGSGATLHASISPINGSGSNLYSELGVKTSLISCSFNQSENGILPIDIDYRQIGLISNPNLKSGGYANSTIYNTSTLLYVSSGSVFVKDERVYQGILGKQTFSGDVLNFDPIRNILYVINTINTPLQSVNIQGITSGAYSQVLYIQTSDISTFSGEILYIENVAPITRSSFSSEQFRLALKF
jgi:hypothetical protein